VPRSAFRFVVFSNSEPKRGHPHVRVSPFQPRTPETQQPQRRSHPPTPIPPTERPGEEHAFVQVTRGFTGATARLGAARGPMSEPAVRRAEATVGSWPCPHLRASGPGLPPTYRPGRTPATRIVVRACARRMSLASWRAVFSVNVLLTIRHSPGTSRHSASAAGHHPRPFCDRTRRGGGSLGTVWIGQPAGASVGGLRIFIRTTVPRAYEHTQASLGYCHSTWDERSMSTISSALRRSRAGSASSAHRSCTTGAAGTTISRSRWRSFRAP
jgi:hypothetical protein